MRYLPLLALLSAALFSFSPSVLAGGNEGYLVDKDGKIVKSANGLCVRSVRWTEAKADRECLEKLRSTKMATRS